MDWKAIASAALGGVNAYNRHNAELNAVNRARNINSLSSLTGHYVNEPTLTSNGAFTTFGGAFKGAQAYKALQEQKAQQEEQQKLINDYIKAKTKALNKPKTSTTFYNKIARRIAPQPKQVVNTEPPLTVQQSQPIPPSFDFSGQMPIYVENPKGINNAQYTPVNAYRDNNGNLQVSLPTEDYALGGGDVQLNYTPTLDEQLRDRFRSVPTSSKSVQQPNSIWDRILQHIKM